MSLAATIDAMVASGCSREQMQEVVRAHEVEERRKREMSLAAEQARRDEKRAAAADRQARKRDRDALERENRNTSSRVTSRDSALHGVTEGDKARVGAQGERAFVSLSEESPPSPPKGGSAPRDPGGSGRGFRLPDDFEPNDATIETGERVGHTRRHILGEGLDEFRDYWHGIPGAKGRRTDWQGTYRNRLRATAPRSPRQARAGPASADGIEEARRALRERAHGRNQHEADRLRSAGAASSGDRALGVGPSKQNRDRRDDEEREDPLLDLIGERTH